MPRRAARPRPSTSRTRSHPEARLPLGGRAAGLRGERWIVALVLVVQAALTLWGAARNSVTFDENFHLPDGVMIAAHWDLRASPFNPPLIKAACGAAALAAG